jgi:hypothetical protein
MKSFGWFCIGVNACTFASALDQGNASKAILPVVATAMILLVGWMERKVRA